MLTCVTSSNHHIIFILVSLGICTVRIWLGSRYLKICIYLLVMKPIWAQNLVRSGVGPQAFVPAWLLLRH